MFLVCIYYFSSVVAINEVVVCKMKTDGSADTLLTEHVSQYINVDNGWIYYWTEESNGNHYDLCKIKTDGTGKTVLATGSAATAFNVSGNWLYSDNVVRQMIDTIKVVNEDKLLIIFKGGCEVEQPLHMED